MVESNACLSSASSGYFTEILCCCRLSVMLNLHLGRCLVHCAIPSTLTLLVHKYRPPVPLHLRPTTSLTIHKIVTYQNPRPSAITRKIIGDLKLESHESVFWQREPFIEVSAAPCRGLGAQGENISHCSRDLASACMAPGHGLVKPVARSVGCLQRHQPAIRPA